MSAYIKLSGRLPGDDTTNGLDALYNKILDNPRQSFFITGVIVPTKILDNIEHADEAPEKVITVELRRIEAHGGPSDAPRDVVEAHLERNAKRLGRSETLPLEQLLDQADDEPEDDQ